MHMSGLPCLTAQWRSTRDCRALLATDSQGPLGILAIDAATIQEEPHGPSVNAYNLVPGLTRCYIEIPLGEGGLFNNSVL